VRQVLKLPAPAILLIAILSAHATSPTQTTTNWPNVFNDKGGTRYSPLDQINRSNVTNLSVAWRFHTRDARPGSTIECTPLVIDGVMYLTTVTTRVVALDAATGQPRWAYDPHVGSPEHNIVISGGVNRGVAFWSDEKPDGRRRILLATADARLISIDAKNGLPDPGFGKSGEVDLRATLDRDVAKLPYGATSAPMVFENLVILGFANGESSPAAPGDNRAFDVRTGKELWRFHSIPHEGEYGSDQWPPHAWQRRGGANAWAGFTLDEKAGVLFCATGSATTDFYGADRAGDNLFSNCVLAQDARTGKRLWHFQTVHHDLWDHDNPCPPVLITVKKDGKDVEAVAQLTKTGYCFILDRKTGVPIFGVKEVPVPDSDIPGEHAARTQPVPLKPPALCKQTFADDDATSISPAQHDYVMSVLKDHPHGKPNIPPTTQGTVVLPGYHGGANWSGASFDPNTGLLYVNTNNIPFFCRVRDNGRGNYLFTGYDYFYDQDHHPAVKPPWGLLNCIDVNRGEILWQVPLGEYPELTAKGLPPTGTENFGGTIVTAGGLVFIASSKDEQFHAFDKSTGRLLWQFKLNAGGYATPCTYAVNGKQFVVIAAGGGGKQRTRSGDEYVAFALPDSITAKK
jgi:glucose dehydrogenase